MSHINYWDQVNSWKNLWKFLNGPLYRNKSGPFPLLNVAASWKSSNSEACAKNCLRYMQTTLIMGGGGSVSEFMWGIVGKSEKFNNQEMKENRAFRILFINKKQLQRWQALHRIFLKPQYKVYIGASILYFNASFSDAPYFSKMSQLPG